MVFTKLTCPECNKIFRKRYFIYNPVKKVYLCKLCDKKIGHNIFYISKERRKIKSYSVSRISKYNFQDEEKKVLINNIKGTGVTTDEALKRIDSDLNFIRKLNKTIKEEEKENKMKEKEKYKKDKKIKERLIRGLKGK